MATEISAIVHFCDDVRNEVGGKLSLMGLYRHFIAIPTAQVTFPKLVAVAFVDIPYPPPFPEMEVWLTDMGVSVFPKIKVPLNNLPAGQIPAIRDICSFAVPVELVAYELKVGTELRMHLSAQDFSFSSQPLRIVPMSSVSTQNGLIDPAVMPSR